MPLEFEQQRLQFLVGNQREPDVQRAVSEDRLPELSDTEFTLCSRLLLDGWLWTLPLARTAPALDLDALLGGFRPLFHALDPQQVNTLSDQLVAALQGEGPTITTFLAQTAAVTNTLADRDQLIGQVIGNLKNVVGSLGDQSSQFADAVDSLSTALATVSDRKQDLRNGIIYANAAAASISDLLVAGRAPLVKVVHEADRTADAVLADRAYFERFLDTLPDTYRMLNRQGLYGDFFSFYLCDLILKLNGKGGQPV